LDDYLQALPLKTKTETNENAKPFQYPWMKNRPMDAKYTPKKSVGGLLDSEESTPEHPAFAKPLQYSWTNMPGMTESFLPKRPLLWDCQDPPRRAASLFMNNLAADATTPMPVLLHECTSLVLCKEN
jgi:hypothetical protein